MSEAVSPPLVHRNYLRELCDVMGLEPAHVVKIEMDKWMVTATVLRTDEEGRFVMIEGNWIADPVIGLVCD